MSLIAIPIVLLPIVLSIFGLRCFILKNKAPEKDQKKLTVAGRVLLVSGLLSGIGEIAVFLYWVEALKNMT